MATTTVKTTTTTIIITDSLRHLTIPTPLRLDAENETLVSGGAATYTIETALLHLHLPGREITSDAIALALLLLRFTGIGDTRLRHGGHHLIRGLGGRTEATEGGEGALEEDLDLEIEGNALLTYF